MPVMRQVVEQVRRGVWPGGCASSSAARRCPPFAREIGADDYGCDGASAVDKVAALMAAR